jgi:hypothetical protein
MQAPQGDLPISPDEVTVTGKQQRPQGNQQIPCLRGVACYTNPNPCPTGIAGASAPAGAQNSSSGITNWDHSNPPPNSYVVTAPNGQTFYAPNYANFQAAYASGAQDGLSPGALSTDFGHWGTYDFQRNGNTFIGAYTPASNYAVGIGLNGAGFPSWGVVPFASLYAHVSPDAAAWQAQGWSAAASCGKP